MSLHPHVLASKICRMAAVCSAGHRCCSRIAGPLECLPAPLNQRTLKPGNSLDCFNERFYADILLYIYLYPFRTFEKLFLKIISSNCFCEKLQLSDQQKRNLKSFDNMLLLYYYRVDIFYVVFGGPT